MTSKTPSGQPVERTIEQVSAGSVRPAISDAPRPWLLLVHQLPAKPSNLRVRIWRRLQQIGAVAVKQAVYVLPDSPSAREDFEWLKTEIETGGGEASVFAADTVNTWSSDELVEEFRRVRESDYGALAREIEQALKTARRASAPRRSRQSAARIGENFRRRLSAIEAIDFFGSAGRDRVVTLVSELQRTLSGEAPLEHGAASPDASRRDAFRRRMWVTRPRPGIDRMGSAWLIKRFIDPEARFGFVEQPPTTGGAVPFDMFGVEFTHRGECCTFEMLARIFAISGSAVERLAAIVHDVDLKDAKFGAAEAGTIGALVEGLQAQHADDHMLLDSGITMFEALYRAFDRAARRAGPRPVAGRRGKPRKSRDRR
jgi:hypothetical protein